MHRALKEAEIEILKQNKCWAENWNSISVSDHFDPHQHHLVRFSGKVVIGSNKERIPLDGGFSVRSGIYNSKIHNCTIGDNVYISNVNLYIANYNIGKNVVITNIDRLYTDGVSSFGNGTRVSALNETGGRNVLIYDYLSSHMAYLLVLYRHNPEVIRRVEHMILSYTEAQKSSIGIIGDNARILNCKTIHNTKIGNAAVIDGASRLENGSVNSTDSEPVFIGTDVIADNFIICSNSSLKDGTIIDKCFVGQGCEMGKQYSAENSLFFANCIGMHGEACSIFAGPYTVTHHKSTLLIAGMFSFMNAGSGSNQSNHMYKLGPIHQGIVERGSKTTSDSYVLWPSKIGAFSLVMGRHYNNCDTSLMPFSYLIESDNNTCLVPGVNLRSVGTIRDAKKWPKRDKRGDSKIDQINFNLLSPYTIQKMLQGGEILRSIINVCGEDQKQYSYEKCIIDNSALKKGIKYYEMGAIKFFGNSVINRLKNVKAESIDEIIDALKPKTEIGIGSWVDISGLIAPKSEITRIMNQIADRTLDSLESIHNEFVTLHQNYYEYEWSWVYDKLHLVINKENKSELVNEILTLVKHWKNTVVELDQMLYKDAKKEFTLSSKTGFGADGNKETKNIDFENVRGEFNSNGFVLEVLDHIEKKTVLGDEIIDRLKHLL